MIIHIVLLVLKIIGIMLSVLIGVVLFLLCLALFVPVRYQIRASRSEEEEPPVRINGKVSWLFPLLQVRFIYPSNVYLKAKILFFTVFQMPSKENIDKSSGNASKKHNHAKKKQLYEKTEEINTGEDMISDPKPNIDAEPISGSDPSPDSPIVNDEKINFFERIKVIISKIRQFIQKIQYTIESLYDKIKGIRENITYYLELIQSDMFLQAFGLCKEELLSILAYISPKKIEADLTLGMGDPSATGQVLAVYGILYPLVGNHVRIIGDFEQKKIEGTIFIKGRLTLFRFLKAACRIYFNRDMRKLIKILKKEDA